MEKRRKLVSIAQLQSGEIIGVDSNGDTWTHLPADDFKVQKWVKSELADLPQGHTGDTELDEFIENSLLPRREQ